MSGTRFARSGRCRLFICLLSLMLMFGMVAIFHSSQQQLDETREQRMRCEQQQEALNMRLQSIVEQKYNLEKTLEHERDEQMNARKGLEQKLTSHVNEQQEAGERYEKLQQNFNALQNENKKLIDDNNHIKKQHADATIELEKKLQSLRSELEKEKKAQNSDSVQWKEKYNILLKEKERLETIVMANDPNASQQRISHLEHLVAEYKSNCEYKPKDFLIDGQQQINKPLNPPDTTRNISPLRSGFDKPENLKSFNEQKVVSPDLYKIPLIATNKTLNVSNATTISNVTKTINAINSTINTISAVSAPPSINIVDGGANGVGQNIMHNIDSQLNLPFSARNNRSFIINSVENFQIAPKPLKKVSEEIPETQLKQHQAELQPRQQGDIGNPNIASPLSAPLKQSTESKKEQVKKINSAASSTSTSPPLSLPLSQRRQLPINVAPIPENFEELLKGDAANQKAAADKFNNIDPADIDAAAEDLPKNENDNDNDNNRYANVVNDMEQKAKLGGAANEDSGAHEIKDHDFINEPNFNLPADEDNFFGGGVNKQEAVAGAGGGAGNEKKHNAGGDHNDDDDDLIGNAGAGGIGGDIAVKNQNLLDADNLNNEVMRDQGKEFPADGLRLEDGNDEDEDEDDYSNPAARKAGQAIRN